mmetsp:Transcript_49608/g.124401  ORF Transcript_49608/g.124401 Transcript_49608/m.124401 type:complete len:83 (+) Transcript_49608:556-804(+)
MDSVCAFGGSLTHQIGQTTSPQTDKATNTHAPVSERARYPTTHERERHPSTQTPQRQGNTKGERQRQSNTCVAGGENLFLAD